MPCAAELDAELDEEDGDVEDILHRVKQDFSARIAEQELGARLADGMVDWAQRLFSGLTAGATLHMPRQPTGRTGRQQAHRAPPPPPPPRPPPPANREENARVVMGFGLKAKLTVELVKERKRALAKMHHPDQGGDVEVMQRVNAASEVLLELLAKGA